MLTHTIRVLGKTHLGEIRSGFRVLSSTMASSKSSEQTSTSTARDFQFPVPWGHIAGKEWGDPSGYPWIVLHGWLDNCGSFDTLAPLFDPSHRLICLDVPGHGFSSHIPNGFNYHYLEGMHTIRRAARHFKLSKFGLMGHSMGGGMAMTFAATHPDMTSHLIMLDVIKPIARSAKSAVERTRQSVNECLNFEEKLAANQTPVYSYDEAKAKLLQASIMIHGNNTITEESADVLLKRGAKPSPCGKGVVYTRDLKNRVTSLYGYPQEVILKFVESIKCPHLIIKAKSGPYYEKKENADEALDIYRQNPNFVYAEIEGSHHVHLNDPELVIQHIRSFLSSNVFKQEELSKI